MNKTFMIAAISLTLTGCDRLANEFASFYHQSGEPKQVIIPPGSRINFHGAQALVYGDSDCQKNSIQNKIEDGCIVIKPSDKLVSVHILKSHDAKNVIDEIWTIDRSGESMSLKHPDGSYVVSSIDSDRS